MRKQIFVISGFADRISFLVLKFCIQISEILLSVYVQSSLRKSFFSNNEVTGRNACLLRNRVFLHASSLLTWSSTSLYDCQLPGTSFSYVYKTSLTRCTATCECCKFFQPRVARTLLWTVKLVCRCTLAAAAVQWCTVMCDSTHCTLAAATGR